MLKWIVLSAIALTLLLFGFSTYNKQIVEPRLIAEITNEPEGDRARRVALLTFADGDRLLANYLQEGQLVFMGADGGWWRKFPESADQYQPGAKVTLLIKGQEYHGSGKVVLNNQTYTDQIFAKLRPTVPKWLPDWLNGKLIVIELDEQP